MDGLYDNKYRIKTSRAEWHDYSGGMYFITVCTHNMQHFFGYIDAAGMHLSPLGRCVEDNMKNVADHYPYAEIPLYVVMPNHIHFMLIVRGQSDNAVSKVVGGIKCAVTRWANKEGVSFRWQSRYYDHIVRNIDEMNSIAGYIGNNVTNWQLDKFYR